MKKYTAFFKCARYYSIFTITCNDLTDAFTQVSKYGCLQCVDTICKQCDVEQCTKVKCRKLFGAIDFLYYSTPELDTFNENFVSNYAKSVTF